MKTTIVVTSTEIKQGKRGHPNYCPIALALLRKTGRKWHVSSTWIARVFSVGVVGKSVDLPEKVKTFLYNFDEGLKVKPIRFTVELPLV